MSQSFFDKPIAKFILPFCVWGCAGMIVLIISDFMLISDEMSICEFDETNWNGVDYNSPQEERDACLQIFDIMRVALVIVAFMIGVITGWIRVLLFKDNSTTEFGEGKQV